MNKTEKQRRKQLKSAYHAIDPMDMPSRIVFRGGLYACLWLANHQRRHLGDTGTIDKARHYLSMARMNNHCARQRGAHIPS